MGVMRKLSGYFEWFMILGFGIPGLIGIMTALISKGCVPQ